MGKKLLIQFMIVWGVCVSAYAREQQASDTSTVVKMNLDTPDFESLREPDLIRLVYRVLDLKVP